MKRSNILRQASGAIPMPVSVTYTRKCLSSGLSYPIRMLPVVVNLMALFIKLETTWCKRLGSLTMTHCGKVDSKISSTPGFTLNCMERTRSPHKVLMSKSLNLKSKVPASIFDRSRISEISWSNNSLFSSTILAYSSFSSGSSVSTNKLEKPTMAFNGVRIS